MSEKGDMSGPLVEALRAELQEYGGLLHLFEEQQHFIVARNPAGFLSKNPEVEVQMGRVGECRRQRERLVEEMAVGLGWPKDSALSSLMTELPGAVRPLLRALMDEINALVAQVQRRTHQNRMLLAQAVELARQRLTSVDPHALPGTYSAQGTIEPRVGSGGGFSAQVA
jgi:hypothetical protein